MRYGIHITTNQWACENGGDDITGTEEEMLAWVAQAIRENGGPLPHLRYTVEPYNGEDGRPPGVTDADLDSIHRERAALEAAHPRPTGTVEAAIHASESGPQAPPVTVYEKVEGYDPEESK